VYRVPVEANDLAWSSVQGSVHGPKLIPPLKGGRGDVKVLRSVRSGAARRSNTCPHGGATDEDDGLLGRGPLRPQGVGLGRDIEFGGFRLGFKTLAVSGRDPGVLDRDG